MDEDEETDVRIKAATAAKKDNGKPEQTTPVVQVNVNNSSTDTPTSFDMDDM